MTYKLEREIPIEEGYDIIVAGGGPAGSAAAICAARLGAKVLLVEATGCLGGMATSGLVCAFDPMGNGERALVQGFMGELVETLYERDFMAPGIDPGNWRKHFHRWSQFRAEGLKLILDEMAQQAGVEVRFFTKVIDAQVSQDSSEVTGVVIHNIDGYSYIKAKKYIDGTGDAVLAALCGVPYLEAGRDTPIPMPSTLTALFAGIDWSKPGPSFQNPKGVELLEKEFEAGMFEQCDRHFVGLSKVGETVGYMNGGHIFNLVATNNKSLSEGMVTGRRIVPQYQAFLKKYSPNSENIELVTTGALMGVRESRRIVGEYELNLDDYLARRQFPDQIGVFNKSLDVHMYDCSREEYDRLIAEFNITGRLKEGECFGIPYGIIVPKGFNNLWVAGRCASSDIKVNGSIRVMPAAGMMGQAAGTAAVQCLKSGKAARDVDTAELVTTLRASGAYLPQEALSSQMTVN